MMLDELIAVLAKKQALYPGTPIRVYLDDGEAVFDLEVGAVGPDFNDHGLAVVLHPSVTEPTETTN